MLTCGSQVKKPLVAFLVAFVLSLGFSFFSQIARAESIFAYTNLRNTAVMEASITFVGTLLYFALFALSFGVFYFLAKTKIINVEKTTVLALLLGFILGSAIMSLFPIMGFRNTNLLVYSSLILGSLVSGVSQYFFPSLSGLLLAKLREKKSSNNLIV
jgi:hypothetical protein